MVKSKKVTMMKVPSGPYRFLQVHLLTLIILTVVLSLIISKNLISSFSTIQGKSLILSKAEPSINMWAAHAWGWPCEMYKRPAYIMEGDSNNLDLAYRKFKSRSLLRERSLNYDEWIESEEFPIDSNALLLNTLFASILLVLSTIASEWIIRRRVIRSKNKSEDRSPVKGSSDSSASRKDE